MGKGKQLPLTHCQPRMFIEAEREKGNRRVCQHLRERRNTDTQGNL